MNCSGNHRPVTVVEVWIVTVVATSTSIWLQEHLMARSTRKEVKYEGGNDHH